MNFVCPGTKLCERVAIKDEERETGSGRSHQRFRFFLSLMEIYWRF